MVFPWKKMKDGTVWFRHNAFGLNHPVTKCNTYFEEVTLVPTFGLHYMRAMREASLIKGTNRLGKYGRRLAPTGLRFWLESKWYGPSAARLRARRRMGLSTISHDVEQSMYVAKYPSE